MQDSWIKRTYRTAKRKLQSNHLIQLLIVSLIAEKQPRRLQKQQPKYNFNFKKSDLLIIFFIVTILLILVYTIYQTGSLESTGYYYRI